MAEPHGVVRKHEDVSQDDPRVMPVVAEPRGVVRRHEDVSSGDPRVEATEEEDADVPVHVLVDYTDEEMPDVKGVEDPELKREIMLLLEEWTLHNLDAVDVAELFNPRRFGERAMVFGLVPGAAFDLRTGLDLSQDEQRAACWQRLEEDDPEFIVGSPMCGPSSALQALVKNHSPQW